MRETTLAPDDLVYPFFVVPGDGVRKPIASMPGIDQLSVDALAAEARELASLGIKAVLLFGIPSAKDETGAESWADDGVVQAAIRALKDASPELVAVTDVCLCEYTDHGHCGLLDADGYVLNDETLEVLGRIAVSHAEAGADGVAPSGMRDGMVGAIRAALDGSGVERVEDMKGKRISVGSAGSSTEGAADRILEAAGLNPTTDVTRDNLSVAESVAAMKDRKIDAFFWIGGLPTAAVTDLVATPNLKVKFIKSDQYVESMRQKYGPVYAAYTLPANTYSGIDPVPGIGIGNILFVNASMNPDLVSDILKTIFDNLAEVRQIHPEGRVISLESATQGSSIPFHPGAVRFYTEKGVWKP